MPENFPEVISAIAALVAAAAALVTAVAETRRRHRIRRRE